MNRRTNPTGKRMIGV